MRKKILISLLVLLVAFIVSVIILFPQNPKDQEEADTKESKQDIRNTISPEKSINQPLVEAADQKIKDGTIVVKKVVTTEPGWITIHTEKDGTLGPVIGQSPVAAGTNSDVIVRINSEEATPVLYAILHIDLGKPDVYEFPGPDAPLQLGDYLIAKQFRIISADEQGKGTGTGAESGAPEAESSPPAQKKTPQNSELPPAPSIKEFTMTARQWKFDPETITVNEGDTVKLQITSVDVTHGFALSEFGINEFLEPGKTVNIEFIADKKGTFTFFCSVFCGSGHSEMKGTLIVK